MFFYVKFIAFIEYMILPLQKEKLRKINDVFKNFLTEEQRNSKKYIRKLKLDLLFSRRYYLITYAQYFLFNFEKLNRVGRKEFVGEYEKKQLTYSLHDEKESWRNFKDKYQAYIKFQKFYRREIIRINEHLDYKLFRDFTNKHRKFMFKAIDKAEGNGIYKIDQEIESIDYEKFFNNIIELAPCVLEEYIEQDKEMAKFHPESVNTVRFVTFLKDNELVRMFALLRMGCGGSHVDNAGAGGIVAAIDIESGIIKTLGYREDRTCYLHHPDTKVQIIGAQIPKWEELLALVDELVRVVPEQKYVGWDLALTNDGWCMIEGNDRAMFTGVQMCEQRGIRHLINKTFKACEE